MLRSLFLLFCVSTAWAAPGPSGTDGRISADLRTDAVRTDLNAGATFRDRILRPADGVLRVVVETDVAATELDGFGTVEVSVPGRVQMTVRPAQLSALAAVDGVRRVRRPWIPTPKAVTQGLSMMGADTYHSAGYDGSGVSIGVLDIGFPDWNNLSGDLPAMSAAQVGWSPSIGGPGSNPHGTACAEIIYDLAPGATQYFANFGTDVEFSDQLQWLADAGVDIVSASIGWDNVTPMDGSGWIAATVDWFHDNEGLLYVAAAGNEGEQYWIGDWEDLNNDGHADFLSNAWTDRLLLFDNTGGNDIIIDSDNSIQVIARWSEGFEAAGFDLDLEIYVADVSSPTTVVTSLATSDELQDGDDYPIEFASYFGTIETDQAVLARLYQADPSQNAPSGLWLRIHAGMALPLDYQVRANSLSSPADSERALTVGAVQHSDLFITGYSSEGPTEDGRDKPDVFGISHVDTESYGPFANDYSQPGFNGTSAATPHVSAIAALLLEESPSLDNDGLKAAVIASVDPTAIQGGGDTFGSGLVNLGAPLGDDDDDVTGDDDDFAGTGDIEPNNSVSEASPVDCGESIEGRAEDEDWFALTVNEAADVTVDLNWTGGGDLDLYLYDELLNQLDRSEQTNTASESVTAAVDAGTYYLWINPYEGIGEYWFEPDCVGVIPPDDDDATSDDDDATSDDDDVADDDDAGDDDDQTLELPDDDDDDGPPDDGQGCQGCQGCGGSFGGAGLWGWTLLLLIRRRR